MREQQNCEKHNFLQDLTEGVNLAVITKTRKWRNAIFRVKHNLVGEA